MNVARLEFWEKMIYKTMLEYKQTYVWGISVGSLKKKNGIKSCIKDVSIPHSFNSELIQTLTKYHKI